MLFSLKIPGHDIQELALIHWYDFKYSNQRFGRINEYFINMFIFKKKITKYYSCILFVQINNKI